MKIKGEGVFCDHCMVQFETDKRTGRLFAGRKKIKGFRGFLGTKKFAVQCLFRVLLCEDCDNAIKRKAVPKRDVRTPGMRKYLKDVEEAKVPPPWSKCEIRNKNGNRMCVPVTLGADGRPKKLTGVS